MTHSFPTRLSSDLKRTDPSRPGRLDVIERNDWASTSGKLLMSRVFTREEFYDLVWSKPMTHLAKEFALSDVALHKVCKKHNIPNPPLGWWGQKAAGKPVKQIGRASCRERVCQSG